MKKLLYLLPLFFIAAVTYAQVTVPQGGTGQISFPMGSLIYGLSSLRLGATSSPTVGYITATSTVSTSTLPYLNVSLGLALNGDYLTDITGSGLTITNNALTLVTSGDWSGTFDGQEGSYYLANSFSTTSANYFISASSTIPHIGGSQIGDLLKWTGTAWGTTSTSTLGYSWNNLTSIPADFADGIDNTGGAPAWGSITGTLSDQTDLQNALNLKIDNSTTSLPKITHLAGLVDFGSSSATTTALGHLKVTGGFTVGTDYVTDITGTGLAISSGILSATLGTSIGAGEIENGVIVANNLATSTTLASSSILSLDASGNFTKLTCAQITGSATLCDGDDASGAGGSGPIYWALNGTTLFSSSTLVQVKAINASTTATSTIENLGGVLDATAFSGADIGAQINAAYAALPARGGRIKVPAGQYSFSTAIQFTTADKPVLLECEPDGATSFTYTGSATSTYYNVGAEGVTARTHYAGGIENCEFNGPDNSASNAGIEVGGSNGASGFILRGTRWYNFTTGLYFNSNTYIINIEDNFFNFNGRNVVFKTAGTNMGEGMRFRGNTFASFGTKVARCFDLGTYQTSILSEGNSYDDCQLYIGAGTLHFDSIGDHFENPSGNSNDKYTYVVLESSPDGLASASFRGTTFVQQSTTKVADAYIDNRGSNLEVYSAMAWSDSAPVASFILSTSTNSNTVVHSLTVEAGAASSIINNKFTTSLTDGFDYVSSKGGLIPFAWNASTTGSTYFYASSSVAMVLDNALGTTHYGTVTAPAFVGTSTTATSTFLHASTSYLSIANDYVTDITGTGLVMSGSALTASLGTDIAPAEMSNSDFGSFTCSGGTCTVDNNAISLTTQVTGTLPIGSGGTNATAFSPHTLVAYNGTSLVSSSSPSVSSITATSSTSTFAVAVGVGTTTFNDALSVVGTGYFSNNVSVGYTGGGVLGGSGMSGRLVSNVDNGNSTVVDLATRRAENTTASLGSQIFWGRQRGTLAAPTVISTGDSLYDLYGYGYDGTDYAKSTDIQSLTEGTIAANALPGVLAFSTADGSGALAERMRITSVGRVGIGTSTPAWPLQISSSTVPQLTLTDKDAAANKKHWTMRSSAGNLYIATSSDAYATSSTAAMTISPSSGTFLGVGTSSPWRTLSVTGTVALSGLTTSGAAQSGYLCLSAQGEVINDSTTCLVSARRFKKEIHDSELGLATILALRPVNYYLKDPTNDNDKVEQVGFIAEEAAEVDPRLITHTADGQVLSVRYENMTAVLAKAIQELYEKTGEKKRSSEEKWQWITIIVLASLIVRQQIRLWELEKTIE